MGKKSQTIGASGENLAKLRLHGIGVDMVEKIGTPMKLLALSTRIQSSLRRMGCNPKNVFRIVFGEKVSGDHRGIISESGKSVLAETKTILDRNLRWSDLRKHQPERLDVHHLYGGISLLVWITNDGVYVMEWPVPGFGPGRSISLDRAKELEVDDIRRIS